MADSLTRVSIPTDTPLSPSCHFWLGVCCKRDVTGASGLLLDVFTLSGPVRACSWGLRDPARGKRASFWWTAGERSCPIKVLDRYTCISFMHCAYPNNLLGCCVFSLVSFWTCCAATVKCMARLHLPGTDATVCRISRRLMQSVTRWCMLRGHSC